MLYIKITIKGGCLIDIEVEESFVNHPELTKKYEEGFDYEVEDLDILEEDIDLDMVEFVDYDDHN